ncbi:NAD(P)/FAD-dependent oxidoreductase [Glacieibacterium frigidum]|uniref:FAD-binding oxidoreductase n=1 Tax=Glacieibacterium frigidum TaxID=2593303 RepID=A0A552UJ78_9SPHN|nr:FAD-dependent oxidoreductase [Glacieibacterium frigidum]TRW18299.1 FAD-binding oxidoreductase [Glacieibacterium frigidum]
MRPRIAIVGAGMGGASLAWALGDTADVTLIEAEAHPGYHTTGRSAAFWVPSYGGPAVLPLTAASRDFFMDPPPGFARPLLTPRAGLHLAAPGDDAAIGALAADFDRDGIDYARLDAGALAERFPMLAEGWSRAGLLEGDCWDIDVAALHAGFLGGARRAGTALLTDARVTALHREGAGWRIVTTAGEVAADIVVDAAGAWADGLAELAGAQPLSLTPLRRTMVVLDVDPVPDPTLPVTFDAAGTFYFKPDAGRMWVSPHDEIPDVPRDAAPEEMDIAVAVDRFQSATRYRVRRVERHWAGLRTFAPDRAPVIGFDAAVPGFFWCAGQGGIGIQTAPAWGRLAADLLLVRETQVDAAPYDPARLAKMNK